MTDERTCETCEFSEMYWAPKGATTRRICKRSAFRASCAVERATDTHFLKSANGDLRHHSQACGPLAIFWKKKEWV